MREAVLNQYHWLDARQFLDAVAVGFMTPGPALITVAFIGYIVAGLAGATVSSIGIFSPSWVFTLGTAPFYEKIVRYRAAQNAVDGISAAAVGAIAGAGLLIAKDALGNPLQNPLGSAITAITLLLLARAPKIPDVMLLAGAAAFGVLAQR
jgi:chromate transporter